MRSRADALKLIYHTLNRSAQLTKAEDLKKRHIAVPRTYQQISPEEFEKYFRLQHQVDGRGTNIGRETGLIGPLYTVEIRRRPDGSNFALVYLKRKAVLVREKLGYMITPFKWSEEIQRLRKRTTTRPNDLRIPLHERVMLGRLLQESIQNYQDWFEVQPVRVRMRLRTIEGVAKSLICYMQLPELPIRFMKGLDRIIEDLLQDREPDWSKLPTHRRFKRQMRQ